MRTLTALASLLLARASAASAGSALDIPPGAHLVQPVATLHGRVFDEMGRGVAGVRVATWPRSAESVSLGDGAFELAGATVYNRTVVTVRKEGWYSTLAAWDRLDAITLARQPDLRDVVPPHLFGHNYWMWLGASPVDHELERVKTMGLEMLRFGGTALEDLPDEGYAGAFERFMVFTQAIGAEPYVQVPLRNGSPERSAELVRLARERGWHIRYWSIGNEEDVDWVPKLPVTRVADLVREHIIAMKLVDPSILVSAGELSWRYQTGDEDWVTPLVRPNADVLNFFSIHRYLFAHEAEQTVANVVRASDDNEAVLRHVQGLIDSAADVHIPLLVTEANVGSTGDPDVAQPPAGSSTFWGAYTLAQLYGIGMKLRIPTIQPWSLAEGWTLGAIAVDGPRPAFYGVQMVARELGDLPEDGITAGNAALRVYATRHSEDGSWAVLVLHPGEAPAPGVLHLGRREVRRDFAPCSITVLRVKRTGQERALVYTKEMAEGRRPPAWEPQ